MLPLSADDLGPSDGDELLGDHGQHLDVDPVELIKTAPGARLSQPREEPTHHLYKQTDSGVVGSSASWCLIARSIWKRIQLQML